MNDAIPVPLKTGPDFALILRLLPPLTAATQHRKGKKSFSFSFFPEFFNLFEVQDPSPGKGRLRRAAPYHRYKSNFFSSFFDSSSITACAAASLARGTRNGEQLT